MATGSYRVASLRIGYDGRIGCWQLSPFFGVSNLFAEEYDSNVRINAAGARFFEPVPDRCAACMESAPCH